MRSRCRATALLVAIALTTWCAPAPSGAQSSFNRERLDNFLDTLERHGRVMGSVVVAKNGTPIYTRILGFRDMAHGASARADDATMYRVGSISKLFTAVLIFRLVEAGTLTLDTPVSHFFPAAPNAGRITIRHLLSHTSGLQAFPRNVNYDDPNDPIHRSADRGEVLRRLAADTPLFAAGTRRQYSNANFILLGYIAESATGRSYADLLREGIIERARLSRTRLGDTVRTADNEAHSFDWSDGQWAVHTEEHLSHAAGAGGIVSTGADLARFTFQLFASDQILGAAMRSAMTSPLVKAVGNSTGGIGVGELDLGTIRRTVFQHDGRVDGFLSLLTYVPQDSVTISVLLNGVNYPLVRVFRAAIRSYYDLPIEVPSFAVITLPDGAMREFSGTFECKQAAMTIKVRPGRGALGVQVRGQEEFTMGAIGPATFAHAPSGIIIDFTRGQDRMASGFELYQQGGTLSCTRAAAR
jgi:D-alanyl-D-alanine carboxypeptidase